VPALKRIVDFLHRQGGLVAAQLHHCGPKALRRRPRQGLGPLDAEDTAKGEPPWQPVSASAEASLVGWLQPRSLTIEETCRRPGHWALTLVSSSGRPRRADGSRCDRAPVSPIEKGAFRLRLASEIGLSEGAAGAAQAPHGPGSLRFSFAFRDGWPPLTLPSAISLFTAAVARRAGSP
jgi:hypothetical protein